MSIAHSARQAHRSDWVDGAARAGLVAYAVVYLIIGWLAIQLALGDHQGKPSSTGALRELAQQPFGEALVWAVGFGMFLLAAWQLLEAAAGHHDDDGGKRTAHRLGSAGKAVVYAAIGVSAVRVALGSGGSGSGGSGSGGSGSGGSQGEDAWTGRLMDLPGGQLLVGAVGLAIVGYGVFQAYRAWTESFAKKLDAEGRSGDSGRAYLAFGRAGYAARGLAFGVVGCLFVYAAATHSAKKSGGLDQALFTLLSQPFGPVLLGATGIGLACYGLFTLARARHLSR